MLAAFSCPLKYCTKGLSLAPLCFGLVIHVMNVEDTLVLGVKRPDCLNIAKDLPDLLQGFSYEMLEAGQSGDPVFLLTSGLRIRKGEYEGAKGVGEDK